MTVNEYQTGHVPAPYYLIALPVPSVPEPEPGALQIGGLALLLAFSQRRMLIQFLGRRTMN